MAFATVIAVGAVAAVRLVSHAAEAAFLGGVAFLSSLYGLRAAALLCEEVPWRIVLVDRRVPLGDVAKQGGADLYLYAADLDQLAASLDVQPLSNWVAPRLDAGIARHDPLAALTTVDALLAAEGLPLEAAEAVRDLRARLAGAAAAGAQFCLRDGQAWSGAIETNLRLYWG